MSIFYYHQLAGYVLVSFSHQGSVERVAELFFYIFECDAVDSTQSCCYQVVVSCLLVQNFMFLLCSSFCYGLDVFVE